MPPQAPFAAAYPALYLYPLNDSFVPKHISLLHNQRVKIGRQTNAKTTPGERNGYFDSKVLSRQHAEVWEEGNKIYIKDVKSSNGTFINGDRLSPEGVESDPYELKSDDIVEFGIDIVGEDNKTIVHHKVAARVVCILSEQDVQMAARAEQHQMHQMQQQQQQQQQQQYPSGPGSMMNQAGPSNVPPTQSNSSFGFPPNQQQRRPPIGHQGFSGMGGMGGSMRPPGKSGLTFDHILTRLQGELQKSRETGSELSSVTSAMSEIQETLGGGLPPNASHYSQILPPVRPPPASQAQPSELGVSSHDQQPSTSTSGSSAQNPTLLSELQSQLQETQNSLAQHVEKIRSLESALKEQEVIRHEVRILREMMDAVRIRDGEASTEAGKKGLRDDDLTRSFDIIDEEMMDHDDAMSVSTVIPHELERVDEEDEEQLLASNHDDSSHRNDVEERQHSDSHGEDSDGRRFEADDEEAEDEERRQRREELGRPHTPEPTGLGMRDSGDLYDPRMRSKTLIAPRAPVTNGITSSVVEDLTSRLATLSSQLESALELSSSLQAQHTTAQSTISSLESKVEALEGLVKATLAQQQPAVQVPEPTRESSANTSDSESLTAIVAEWKKSVEGQWSSVREEWHQERERLNRAREEWEAKSRSLDSGLEKLDSLQRSITHQTHFFSGNGDIARESLHHTAGLVTPPSPRSLSADSQKPRRRRSSSARGRSSSKKRSMSKEMSTADAPSTWDDDASHKNGLLSSRTYFSSTDGGASSLITPAPSDGTVSLGSEGHPASSDDPAEGMSAKKHPPSINIQTAVGVLVLSVAAAAVIWRVKPDNT